MPANQEIVLEAIKGNTLELEAEIDPQDVALGATQRPALAECRGANLDHLLQLSTGN